MVTIGFIVEGDSEAILLKQKDFIDYLAGLNLNTTPEMIINARGKNKLYHPSGDFSKIEQTATGYIKTLLSKGCSKVIIILDFDNADDSFSLFKQKVFHLEGNILIIAKQAIEAWYLADTKALCNYLNKEIPPIPNPEVYIKPIEEIRQLRLLHSNKGITDKIILTKKMISNGFKFTNAAQHPACFSAQYFVKKINELFSYKN